MADDDSRAGSRRTMKEALSEWLFQQGVSTVLLFAILVALGWSVQYAMTTAIPQHLKSINDGTERIATECKEAVTAEAREHKEAVKTIVESHEKQRMDDRAFYQEVLKDRRASMKLPGGGISDGS